MKRATLPIALLLVAALTLVEGATVTSASNVTTPPPRVGSAAGPAMVWPGPEAAFFNRVELFMIDAGQCANQHEAGDFVESVDGRFYRLHVPDVAAARPPAALVMNFHGSARSAADQEAYSGLLPIADREGFVLVTPEGSGSPSGWDIPEVYHDIGVDDVAFAASVVAAVESEACIDPDRIYATGMSNGAEMASQVACELPGLFAAVAPVAGVLYQGCSTPVAIIAFHGTADANVLFEWAEPAVAGWAVANGCDGRTATEAVAGDVERRNYLDCSGSDIEFYVINGGGHTWPGAEGRASGVGYTTSEINAGELMWRFFVAHPRR